MTLGLKIIFWVCAFFVIYPFALYTPLLRFLLALKKKPDDYACYTDSWPKVTLIISAYNEESVITEKIDNSLALQYPHDQLEVIVISDASDDHTDEIVRQKSAGDNRIRLFRQEDRKGKTAGINAAIQTITGDVVVFSDANALYQADALYELVKFFKDPRVGYVVGAAVYNQDKASLANQSESLYWDKELAIKQMESDFYSVVGGDGAIYAIRKKCFWPLKEDDINDFANPLQIIAGGYRGIFSRKAVCFEDSADDFAKEFRRKRRIVNRSFRAFSRNIHHLHFTRHFRFLFMLFSHKVLRWFSMVFILGFALSALILAATGQGLIYTLGFLGAAASALLGFVGKKLCRNRKCPKIIYMLYYFYSVSMAGLLGILDNLAGRRHVTWDHIRKMKN
jgi:cellulose synthase/poly-beta-1,6-N-acetylglucosamine synthase-like glycosyltransferase